MEPTIRTAGPDDADTIYEFIVALAVYEKEPDAVEATAESLRQQMQAAVPPFECLILEDAGEPRGFALFFHNYSTWRGAQGLYLEDLFVPSEFRGKGYGKNCSDPWRESPWSGGVRGWNGRYSTGTSQRFPSTNQSARTSSGIGSHVAWTVRHFSPSLSNEAPQSVSQISIWRCETSQVRSGPSIFYRRGMAI